MNRTVFLLMMAVIAMPSYGALAVRTNLGLYGGQIEGLATFDISGATNRVYADVRGANALYFSDTLGASWTLSISAEETNGVETDSNYVYAIVNNEVWRSNGNDGLTWTTILDPSITVYTGEPIMSIEHDGTRLMVGCSGGIAYFNPTGNPADWTRHVVNPVSMSKAVVAMTSRPTDPTTILAVIQDGMEPSASASEIHESTDSGTTWHPIPIPTSIIEPVEEIGVDPAHPNHVYIGGSSANATVYLNTSYLDPTTWVDITPSSFTSRYPQYIEFHSGLTWTTAHTYNSSTGTWSVLPSTTVGTNINDGAIAFDPDDPNIAYVSSDVGVSVTEVGGATFEERNTGIEGVQVFDVDVDMASKEVAIVASKSGLAITDVFQKPPTPADWRFPVFPSGHGGPPMTAAAIVWGSTQEFVVGENSENIYLSEDGGVTWRLTYNWVGSPIRDRSSVNDIDSAAASNVLYAAIGFWEGGDDGIVVKSTDRGKTWTHTTLSGVHANSLEVVGSNLVYVGVGHERDFPSAANQGIYASNDGGLTWTHVTWGGSPINAIVKDLAQDPINPAIQYATVQSGTGGGALIKIEYDTSGLNIVALTDLTTTYSGPVGGRYTAVETNDLGTEVYTGMEEHLFLFDVSTSTWSLYSLGLRGEEVFRLYWDALVSGNSSGFFAFKPSEDDDDDEDDEPTPTPMPTPTKEPTATSTHEPEPTNTPTDTPEPTNTPLPTNTPSPIPIPTSTSTPTPEPIPTSTPTLTSTPTEEPTSTPTVTATETPVPTVTPTPTSTPEPTTTPEPTSTPEPTATPIEIIDVPTPGEGERGQVFVYDDPTSTDDLTGQTDFDSIEDIGLTIAWNAEPTEDTAWDIYVRKGFGGFKFLTRVNDSERNYFEWKRDASGLRGEFASGPDVNEAYRFRVIRLDGDFTSDDFIDMKGIVGLNLEDGSAIRLAQPAMPNLKEGDVVIYDDILGGNNLAPMGEMGDDQDESDWRALQIAWDFGRDSSEVRDYHILVRTSVTESFTFLGLTNSGRLSYFWWTQDQSFQTSASFAEGPQDGNSYQFQVVMFGFDGSREILTSGWINYSVSTP